MQLPRGTFREIKKNTNFGGLLEELQQTRFTGICSISFGTANGIIVFKSGKRILAEFKNRIGDSAWDDLQEIVEEPVGAAVSTLDEAQIRLSLEFNKSFRINKVGKAEHSPAQAIPLTKSHLEKKSLVTHPKPASDVSVKKPQQPFITESAALNQSIPVKGPHGTESSKKTVPFHSSTPAQKTSSVIPLQSQVHAQTPQESESLSDETLQRQDMNFSNFDKDIDTFETLDVEAITNKIRGECKTLIKQLHLEHLTER